MVLTTGNSFISGQIYSFGVPRVSKILLIIATSLSQAKSGFMAHNSKKIQPILHMSTAMVYSTAPSNSSGALYQTVTTSWVYGF